MFSLPGRGFHQRVTLMSSVPMTLDDVIVHVRQFIINKPKRRRHHGVVEICPGDDILQI